MAWNQTTTGGSGVEEERSAVTTQLQYNPLKLLGEHSADDRLEFVTIAASNGNIPLLQCLLDSQDSKLRSSSSSFSWESSTFFSKAIKGACTFDEFHTLRFLITHPLFEKLNPLGRHRGPGIEDDALGGGTPSYSDRRDPMAWLLNMTQVRDAGLLSPSLRSLTLLSSFGFGQKEGRFEDYLRSAVQFDVVLEHLVLSLGIASIPPVLLGGCDVHNLRTGGASVSCSISTTGRSSSDPFSNALCLGMAKSAVALLELGQVMGLSRIATQQYLLLIGKKHSETIGMLSKAIAALCPLSRETLYQVFLICTSPGRELLQGLACRGSKEHIAFFRQVLGTSQIPPTRLLVSTMAFASKEAEEEAAGKLYQGTVGVTFLVDAVMRIAPPATTTTTATSISPQDDVKEVNNCAISGRGDQTSHGDGLCATETLRPIFDCPQTSILMKQVGNNLKKGDEQKSFLRILELFEEVN